ncbi:MAG: flavodoxin [Selenomonadaceae bacterium]|nr:flavodoxin [Selenomonadaceae bacterium]
MSKIAVVFWSGTGNTEAMAEAVAEGAKAAGADVEVFQVDDFSATDMADYNGFLFGCPAMGDEVLEEDSFEPFFTDAEAKLNGVPVALFGSYGWGGGAWMETWSERTKEAGAKFVGNVIAENAPDDEALENCRKLGEDLAKAV